jgi:DNA-directed RNA polymerase subunit RPC12/RpoP
MFLPVQPRSRKAKLILLSLGATRSMNHCPHCNALANPLRLLSMTRRAPYRCGRCGGRSLLRPRHNTIAALIMFAVVLAFGAVVLTFGALGAAICFLAAYVFVVGGVMWFFMQLEPVRTPPT